MVDAFGSKIIGTIVMNELKESLSHFWSLHMANAILDIMVPLLVLQGISTRGKRPAVTFD